MSLASEIYPNPDSSSLKPDPSNFEPPGPKINSCLLQLLVLSILIAAGYFGYIYYLKPKSILANMFPLNKITTSPTTSTSGSPQNGSGQLSRAPSQKSNELPTLEEIVPELFSEPVQSKIAKSEITKEVGDITYYISPQYSYDIFGLVVSYNKYEQGHEKNPLEVTDLCVVWGKSLKNNYFQKAKYRTEGQVCVASPPQDLSEQQLNDLTSSTSNNHLFPQDDQLASLIKSVKIGDQIRIQGYLINYYMRGPNWSTDTVYSSISRNDNGMGSGACESIYVTNFEILKN